MGGEKQKWAVPPPATCSSHVCCPTRTLFLLDACGATMRSHAPGGSPSAAQSGWSQNLPPESPTPGSSPFPGASLPGHPVSRVPPDPIPLEPLLPRNPKRIHTRNPPGSPRHGTPPQKPLPPGPHSDSRNPSDPLEPLAQRRNACDPFPSLELPTREPSLGLPHTFPLPGAPHPRAIPRTPPYLPARSRLPAAQPRPVRSAHSPLHRPPLFSRSAPPPPPRALFITHARRKTASPSANQRSVAQRRHGKVSQ